jgi:hypothetical protein
MTAVLSGGADDGSLARRARRLRIGEQGRLFPLTRDDRHDEQEGAGEPLSTM